MNQSYTTDKVVGVLVVLLGGGCTALAGLALLGLGAIGAAGITGAAGSRSDASTAAAAGALAGMGFIIGPVLLLLAAISVVYGIGVFMGRRWAFMTGAVLNGIAVILDLVGLNFIGVVLHGAFLAYCVMRLTGKLGPTPT